MAYGLSPGILARNPGYTDLAARNRANQGRTLAPYQPSIGDEHLSGPGAYAISGRAGLMSNYQAQQNYGATGYMPNRTVGGAYGLGGHDPLGQNRLTQQQVLSQAGGSQYAPMGAAGLGNPGGRYYGGAQPGMVAGRPAWTDGPPQEASAGQGLAPSRYIGGGTLGRAGEANLAPISPGSAQYGLMQKAQATFDARGGGLAARQAAYQARNAAPTDPRADTLARVGIRANNAQQAQQSAMAMQQQQQLGLMAAMNPQMAMQVAQMNQRGQLAQQQMGLQYAQLGQQGVMGQQQSQDRRYVADQHLLAQQHQGWNARYQQAIKDGHSPSDALQLAGPPPTTPGAGAAPQRGGLMGQQGPPSVTGGYKPKKPLLEAQISQIAALPKGKREAALRAMGVTASNDLAFYQSQLDPTHGTAAGSQDWSIGSALGNGLGVIGEGVMGGLGAGNWFGQRPQYPTRMRNPATGRSQPIPQPIGLGSPYNF